MHHLLSTAEMALADRLALAAGTKGIVLMERAGRAVAAQAVAMMDPGATILVVCGPGNNGGDGFVAARMLAGRGFAVTLVLSGARDTLRGDARLAAESWDGPVLEPGAWPEGSFALVIDALFGAGLSRPLGGEEQSIVERINRSGALVLSVDIPSGIDGDTGQMRGVAVRATRTVTFFRAKPGHYLYPGRAHCGALEIADIGIPANVIDAIAPITFLNCPALWPEAVQAPGEMGHKFDRGHVVVVSGGPEGTGAARLAAQAAARSGAGLVTVASPGSALGINAGALTEVMVRESNGADGLAHLLEDKRRNAVVIGPGGGIGSVMRDSVRVASEAGCRLVLDADALTSFEGDALALRALLGQDHATRVVATPHDGEFSRLFSAHPDILVEADRLSRARAAAAWLGCVVLLKGPDTVIAAPDGRAAISTNGTPWLATAGSGDVLAGLVGGLFGQEVPAFEAAAAGVYLHAEAGREAGPGLIARDLPEALRVVLSRMLAKSADAGPRAV